MNSRDMTHPNESSTQKRVVLIIIIALFIHSLFGFLLFLFEGASTPFHAPAQVIIVDNHKQATTLIPPPAEDWGLVMPKPLSPSANKKENSNALPTQDKQPTSTPEAKIEPAPKEAEPKKESNILALSEKQLQKKTPRPSPQQASPPQKLSLASIGKGFIQQLPKASYGRDFMPGNQRMKMTATQIAIEEYAHRLEKMVNPVFRVLLREVAIPSSVTRPPCLGFNISPEGKLIDFCITESSGNSFYDQQVLTKIKDNNPWGPPMPSAILTALREKRHTLTLYHNH